MPLRDLFYISSEYQKLVDQKSIYSSVLLKLPEPHFIVFYNGTAKMPGRWINYLSEAYERHSSDPNLELKVVTININEGYNQELMKQCRILREYAQYVKKVREYTEKIPLNAAVKQVLDIEYIRDTAGLDSLPENLKEMALLRLEYPEAALKELGTYLNPPVGKSGVNHRLRKLSAIAEELREG